MARSSVFKLPRALIAMMGEEVLNDPLVGDRRHILWTLPMVLAFIKWRTLDAVRWFENGELVHRKAVTVKHGCDPSHFVSKRDLDAAEDRFGPPFDDKPYDPFTQLQWGEVCT